MKNTKEPGKPASPFKRTDAPRLLDGPLSDRTGNDIEPGIESGDGSSGPARFSVKLLELLLPKDSAENIIGCLVEEYEEKISSSGLYGARKWYWKQIQDLFWRFICKALTKHFLLRLGRWLRSPVEATVPTEATASHGFVTFSIIIAISIVLYILYIYLLFHISVIFLPIGSAAIVCVILYNYLTTTWTNLCRVEGLTDNLIGEDAALRQGYFRKAYQDYKHVVKESWKLNRTAAYWTIKASKKFFTNRAVLFTWPLGITFITIVAVGSMAAIAAYAISGLIHLTLIIIYAAFATSLALAIRGLEYVIKL